MASRPFASVAVSLDARGELTEVLQPLAEVSLSRLLAYTHTHTHFCISVIHILYKLILKGASKDIN